MEDGRNSVVTSGHFTEDEYPGLKQKHQPNDEPRVLVSSKEVPAKKRTTLLGGTKKKMPPPRNNQKTAPVITTTIVLEPAPKARGSKKTIS